MLSRIVIVMFALSLTVGVLKALIGQRYGDCPLPRYIRADDFEVIRAAVMRRPGRDARGAVGLLDAFYERDYNQLAPGYYRLTTSRPHTAPRPQSADQVGAQFTQFRSSYARCHSNELSEYRDVT